MHIQNEKEIVRENSESFSYYNDSQKNNFTQSIKTVQKNVINAQTAKNLRGRVTDQQITSYHPTGYLLPNSVSGQDNAQLISVLIQYGAGNPQIPALHNAVKSRDMTAVKILVENKSNINFSADLTPIEIAVSVKDLAIMQYLYSKGAELTVKSVSIAAKGGFLQGLNFLLENKAPLPANSGQLMKEVLENHRISERTGIVKALIRAGADCKYEYIEFFARPQTPKQYESVSCGLLSLAIWLVDLELVKLLIEGGAPINYAQSGTLEKNDPQSGNKKVDIHLNPLFRAICCGKEDIAAYLISKGAVFTKVHQQYLYELFIISGINKSQLQVLLNLNLLHPSQVQPFFDKAISEPWAPHVRNDNQIFAVRELHKRGAVVKDEHLRQCLKYGNKELIAWLLENGARP